MEKVRAGITGSGTVGIAKGARWVYQATSWAGGGLALTLGVWARAGAVASSSKRDFMKAGISSSVRSC
ncbi:hypothetical protein GCM10027422_24660 [Hymenobacter arcticus]